MTGYIKCALCGVFEKRQKGQGIWFITVGYQDIDEEPEYNFCTGCCPNMTKILLAQEAIKQPRPKKESEKK